MLVMLNIIVCLLREMLYRNRLKCYIVNLLFLKGYKIISLFKCAFFTESLLCMLGQEKEQVASKMVLRAEM